MKFSVTFKDPDGVDFSIRSGAARLSENIPGLDDQERKLIACAKADHMLEAIKPWVAWGEIVTIEFDTDAKTATVVRS